VIGVGGRIVRVVEEEMPGHREHGGLDVSREARDAGLAARLRDHGADLRDHARALDGARLLSARDHDRRQHEARQAEEEAPSTPRLSAPRPFVPAALHAADPERRRRDRHASSRALFCGGYRGPRA
jgi:hypothetical protein